MFRKLLVPLDGSPDAEGALAPAAAIARGSHATIDLITVHEPPPFIGFTPAASDEHHVIAEEAALSKTAEEALRRYGMPATHAVLHGGAVDMICSRAHDVGADLIVMITHGRTGISRALLGSVADEVLRHSTVPVLMLRNAEGSTAAFPPDAHIDRILVPLDGSAVALDVLPFAAALAMSSNAIVDLLHVVPRVPASTVSGEGTPLHSRLEFDVQATKRLTFEAKQVLGEAVAKLTALGVARVEPHVIIGDDAVEGILDVARRHKSAAIAMSTHGRGMSRLLVGSVADQVIRGITVPILLYRPASVVAESVVMTAGSVEDQLPALARHDADA